MEKETISRLNFRGESGKRSEKFSPNTTLVLEGDLLKDTETRLRYQVTLLISFRWVKNYVSSKVTIWVTP